VTAEDCQIEALARKKLRRRTLGCADLPVGAAELAHSSAGNAGAQEYRLPREPLGRSSRSGEEIHAGSHAALSGGALMLAARPVYCFPRSACWFRVVVPSRSIEAVTEASPVNFRRFV